MFAPKIITWAELSSSLQRCLRHGTKFCVYVAIEKNFLYSGQNLLLRNERKTFRYAKNLLFLEYVYNRKCY